MVAMKEEFEYSYTAPMLPAVRIRRWRFGLREVVLAIIAGVLLVLCIILACLLISTSEKQADVHTASTIVAASDPGPSKHYCTDVGCLKTATRALSLMNKSVDPCENFYQFACGNYKKTKRVTPYGGGSNVLSDLTEENDDRIIDILEQPISSYHDLSAERKLKDFFTSCKDMHKREKAKGLPILNRVLPELGGWKVLGTWDANWDLNMALKKVQSDFWVRAFAIKRDHHNFDMTTRLETYKDYITRVGQLLVQDSVTFDPPQGNASLRETLLDEFVNDAFTVESYLVTLDNGEDFTDMTLDNFTAQTNNTIDWTGQISYMFNQSGVSGSTVVRIWNLQYFKDLSVYLQSLAEQVRKRILHNYFIWRVLDDYRKELSWEYLHADENINREQNRHDMPSMIQRDCFHLAEKYMKDALNHLYITQFLSVENKQTAHDITDNMRQALKTQIAKTPWMDLPTRQKAQEKLDSITLKIGYPDWMSNQTEIDSFYGNLDVDSWDFFGTVLRMNQFQRDLWNTDLQRIGPDYEDWAQPVYYTKSSPKVEHNQMTISAGFLQFPIYDAVQPQSSSFGSLGAIVGKNLHKFVDGGQESWWSNSTKDQYKLVEQCVQHIYFNLTRPMRGLFGQWTTLKVNASLAAPIAINWVSGVRLALMGYQDWTKKKALEENIIPGLDMTHNQMIFLAHAQAYCEVDDGGSFFKYAGMTAEQNMNMALGQMDEFVQAFQCSETASINHAKKCQYY